MVMNETYRARGERIRKGPVLFVAGKGYEDTYKALCFEAEELIVVSFGEALRVLTSAAPDIVIIDCGFDSRQGIRLLKEIKEASPEIPVILLSDDRSIEAAVQAFTEGARVFLSKPVNIFELKNTIEKLLIKKRTSREKRARVVMAEKSPGTAPATMDKPINLIRAIEFVEANLTSKINLDSLAKEANLSKFHFCRYFCKYMAVSPMRFVSFMRIEKAKEFLKKEDQTISVIALQAGFNDLGTFIRQFKSFTGVTPSVYQSSFLLERNKQKMNEEQGHASGVGVPVSGNTIVRT
jgi:YesN/AraC family two-component response regulator